MTPDELRTALLSVVPVWQQREASGNDFAQGKAEVCRSIATFIGRNGRTASARQQSYGERLVHWAQPRTAQLAEARERSEATPPPTVVSEAALQRVNRLFNAAAEHGIRSPRIDLRLEGRPLLRLTQAPRTGRNPGAIYVRSNNIYSGAIMPDGTYRPVANRPEGTDEFVHAFGDDPIAIARAHGHATGACCFCRRRLTDARSVAMGYGPVCAGHYGLEWGERRAASVVELDDAPMGQPSPPLNGVIPVVANADLPASVRETMRRIDTAEAARAVMRRSPLSRRRVPDGYVRTRPARAPVRTDEPEDEDDHFM